MSDNETPAGETRKCPHCAEWIKAEASVCRFCGRDVTPTVTADTESQATSESETPEETSTGKRKLWLIFVVAGAVVLVGAFVAIVLTRSSSIPPELDAVADTWEQAGPQFRQDVCSARAAEPSLEWQEDQAERELVYQDFTPGKIEARELLRDATLERNPDTFLDRDVEQASQWFLTILFRDAEYVPYLMLDRGWYVNTLAIAEAQAIIDEVRSEAEAGGGPLPDDYQTDAEEYFDQQREKEGVEYLGSLDPWPDPCTDSDD